MKNPKSKHQQEKVKLNNFLKKFLIEKEDKEQELNIVKDILVNRILMHKKGKQECNEIIDTFNYFFNDK